MGLVNISHCSGCGLRAVANTCNTKHDFWHFRLARYDFLFVFYNNLIGLGVTIVQLSAVKVCRTIISPFPDKNKKKSVARYL